MVLAIRWHAGIGIFIRVVPMPGKKSWRFLERLDLRCCSVITRCVCRSGGSRFAWSCPFAHSDRMA